MASNRTYAPGQYSGQGNGMSERQDKDSKNWNKMLQQAALVSKMNEKQALGYGVGRLISTLWNQHLARRHDPNEQERRKLEKQQKDFQALDARTRQVKADMDGLQQQNAPRWKAGIEYTVQSSPNTENVGRTFGFTPGVDTANGIGDQMAAQFAATPQRGLLANGFGDAGNVSIASYPDYRDIGVMDVNNKDWLSNLMGGRG